MGRLRSRIQSRVPPGSEVREVPSDGSCMYWSIKLACEAVHGLMVGVAGLQRQHVVAFMLQNTDYWGEFMEEDSESDLETRVQQYTESILEGKWGDHLELECLAQMHDLHITVVEEPGQTTAVNPTGSRMIYLAFYSECSHYEAVVQPLQTAAQPRSEKILGQQQQCSSRAPGLGTTQRSLQWSLPHRGSGATGGRLLTLSHALLRTYKARSSCDGTFLN